MCVNKAEHSTEWIIAKIHACTKSSLCTFPVEVGRFKIRESIRCSVLIREKKCTRSPFHAVAIYVRRNCLHKILNQMASVSAGFYPFLRKNEDTTFAWLHVSRWRTNCAAFDIFHHVIYDKWNAERSLLMSIHSPSPYTFISNINKWTNALPFRDTIHHIFHQWWLIVTRHFFLSSKSIVVSIHISITLILISHLVIIHYTFHIQQVDRTIISRLPLQPNTFIYTNVRIYANVIISNYLSRCPFSFVDPDCNFHFFFFVEAVVFFHENDTYFKWVN